MKSKLLFSMITLIYFSACQQKEKSNIATQKTEFPLNINLIDALANPKDIKLSEIADSIAYIPLEYVKDNPVGYIGDFKYFAENIFIHVYGSEQKFLRFDGKGKFLNEIGTMGRGPGEFPGGSSFSVIDNPDRLYILCNFVPRNVLEYDYNGNLLTRVLTAHPAVGFLEAISPDRFLFLIRSDTSFHYLADLSDRNNKSLYVVAHPLLSNPKHKNLTYLEYPGARSGTYFNRSPLFWDEFSMDTIYSVLNDSIYPKYTLDKGSEGAPFEILYSRNTMRPDPGITPKRWNYLLPIGFTETFHDVFITAIFKNKELYLINYNKSTQSVSSMKTPFVIPDNPGQPATVSPKFINDIDGGISLGTGRPNREGDVWTYKFDAINFKNQLSKEHFLNSKALHPEKKDALKKLVDSISADDNPIIMVIYLKKPLN